MESHDTEEALRRLSQLLFRHLIKIGANLEDARDIVQEAMYKWLLYADSVEPERVPAWLFRVTMNLYYDLCRKRNRDLIIQLDENALVEENTPEAIALRKDDRRRILRTLNTLPEIQQHLLVLKYEEHLTYEEISMLLGLSASTISTYLQRARNKFKQLYKEEL